MLQKKLLLITLSCMFALGQNTAHATEVIEVWGTAPTGMSTLALDSWIRDNGYTGRTAYEFTIWYMDRERSRTNTITDAEREKQIEKEICYNNATGEYDTCKTIVTYNGNTDAHECMSQYSWYIVALNYAGIEQLVGYSAECDQRRDDRLLVGNMACTQKNTVDKNVCARI
jgi:hypothetical protein